MKAPIFIPEETWANCQMSITRYYGGLRISCKDFRIVNKNGIDIFELSDPDSKHYVKDGMAIPPGEPADLVQLEWIPVYRKLGREQFMTLIKSNPNITLTKAKQLIK
jgi:hypothetical protein